MRREIDTVIYDIGGVLTIDEEKNFYRIRGYSEEMTERLYRATMKSGHWEEFDLGNLSTEEVIDLFVKTDPEIEKEIRDSLSDISELVKKSDAAIPWIRKVKAAGKKALVLSNFSEFSREQCADALTFLPETDGGILSCEHHVIKPMPKIYLKLMEMYDLVPERCVFIDDNQPNLDAAEALGIHTILYRSQEQAEKELDEMLGI